MGTNYYLYEKVCPECGQSPYKPLHIGKSSRGWCSGLHIYQHSSAPADLEEWEDKFRIEGNIIRDEYDSEESPNEMLSIITKRHGTNTNLPPLGYEDWNEFYDMNDAEPGPNNLIRHKIGPTCIEHGDGTWDLLVGDFS